MYFSIVIFLDYYYKTNDKKYFDLKINRSSSFLLNIFILISEFSSFSSIIYINAFFIGLIITFSINNFLCNKTIKNSKTNLSLFIKLSNYLIILYNFSYFITSICLLVVNKNISDKFLLTKYSLCKIIFEIKTFILIFYCFILISIMYKLKLNNNCLFNDIEKSSVYNWAKKHNIILLSILLTFGTYIIFDIKISNKFIGIIEEDFLLNYIVYYIYNFLPYIIEILSDLSILCFGILLKNINIGYLNNFQMNYKIDNAKNIL